MFFHNNKSSILKIKCLISEYKKDVFKKNKSIKSYLPKLNILTERIEEILKKSNIPKSSDLSLVIGRLLYSSQFGPIEKIIDVTPIRGIRWGRAMIAGSAVVVILCAIMLFFLV